MRASLCSLLLGVTLLAACSGAEVKENLGLTRDAPDEFRVVSRPPLSVPKEFYLVPPSLSGEKSSGPGGESAEQARRLVTQTKTSAVQDVSASPLRSNAEERLLKRAGSAEADPNIRNHLGRERVKKEMREEDPGVLGRLRGAADEEPVVDAGKEAERLKENKKKKKPVNAGEVPVVDPKQKSTLERILD
jgi:hypothetical protein